MPVLSRSSPERENKSCVNLRLYDRFSWTVSRRLEPSSSWKTLTVAPCSPVISSRILFNQTDETFKCSSNSLSSIVHINSRFLRSKSKNSEWNIYWTNNPCTGSTRATRPIIHFVTRRIYNRYHQG